MDPTTTAKPLLRVEEASRHFGGHKAVDRVSLELAEGSLTAVIGPNGAGKTTLFNLIAGALAPTSGRILLEERPVRDAGSACALGIARTFQNVRLFHDLTVLENVMTGMGGFSFWRGVLRLPGCVERDRLRMKKAYYLLESLGVAHLAEQPAGEIPFGQQRLVEIARALAPQPRLLLLDEPAAGLNATETARLGTLIQGINDRGLTVLLVEHDMGLVMKLAQRLIVLDQGRRIADGPPAQVRTDPAVCAAYLGQEAAHA